MTVDLTYPRWWNGDGNDRFSETANLREVAPNLFVGAAFTLGFPATRWDTIIDLDGSNVDDPVYGRARVALHFPFEDGLSVPPGVMDACAQAVLDAQGPVLIHCAMGISRSASVALGLLCKSGLRGSEALRRVTCRDGSRPHRGTLYGAKNWASGFDNRPVTRVMHIDSAPPDAVYIGRPGKGQISGCGTLPLHSPVPELPAGADAGDAGVPGEDPGVAGPHLSVQHRVRCSWAASVR